MNPPSLCLLQFIVLFLLSWQAIFRIPNVALDVAFKFFSILLNKLSEFCGTNLRAVAAFFPETLLKAYQFQHIVRDNYQQLIVCSECYSTYEYTDCLSKENPARNIRFCSFVRFPKHPQARMRIPCGNALLKTIRTATKKHIERPIKVFCCQSLVDCCKQLVGQPGMLDMFSRWKNRAMPAGVMSDIYDGAVWKSFLKLNEHDFLLDKHTLGLSLNVDWFRPYKHVEYSVGAMYIAVLNYPRQLRYLRENVILVGIMPGPHEPSLQMNAFIEPLVRDLLKLWNGVEMRTPDGNKTIRAALVCVSCDIPPARKLTGFVGHSALKACSKCLKSFPTLQFGAKPDYGGFNRDLWPKRKLYDHKEQGMKWKHAVTLTERHGIERKFGVRYSELLRLPYFDTIRFSVIDPMHNILLGSAKHTIAIWKSLGILNQSNNDHIQTIVDKFCTPPDVGRIPYKIASGFSSFTADQWKNWILIFSLVALKEIIPEQHYRIWWVFVQACLLICSRAITQSRIMELDSLLISFCKLFEQIYGKDACTPNLHLHGHLKECYLDYGPSSSFWLFAFERLNGILGSVCTNHQAIEVQLMRKFISNQQVLEKLSLESADTTLPELFRSHGCVKGSLRHDVIPELPLLLPLSPSTCVEYGKLGKLLPPVKEKCLNSEQLSSINSLMRSYFGESFVRTLMFYTNSSRLLFQGVSYGCHNSLAHSSSIIYVETSIDTKPAVIRNFISVSVLLQAESDIEPNKGNVVLAGVDWLQEHEKRNFFGSPVEVWCKYTVGPGSSCHAYVPVVCIKCKCAYLDHVVQFNPLLKEEVTLVVPMNHFTGL
ncbi:hypothetical protein SPONN_25 [uncultured Candidatus Thioglobus sp.]|nr:hypothetical protein SPONN_25 [uncultured Candidatus Thioglobus sp.]